MLTFAKRCFVRAGMGSSLSGAQGALGEGIRTAVGKIKQPQYPYRNSYVGPLAHSQQDERLIQERFLNQILPAGLVREHADNVDAGCQGCIKLFCAGMTFEASI